MPIDRQQLAARLRETKAYEHCCNRPDWDAYEGESHCCGRPDMLIDIEVTEAERDALLAALGAEADPPWPAELKALYDATSVLQAVLNFTSDTADLLSEEMDYATRLLMTVRSRIRERFGIEIDTPAALIKPVEIPGKFAARRLPSPPSSGREEQET